jgi:hypothetical protein
MVVEVDLGMIVAVDISVVHGREWSVDTVMAMPL